MQDLAPEILEAVERSFRENLNNNKEIERLQELLTTGKATYHEADKYAVEVGQALAKAFRDNVTADVLPDGRMYYNIASRVLPPPLRASYEEIANYAEVMQRGMNERARIGIKAIRPKYNTDREKGLIEYASGAEKYENIKKNLEEDLINFEGGCCDWCSKLAGTYPYEQVRDTGNDVYRRHRFCRCNVTYDPQSGRIQNVHTKGWEPRRPTENR